MTGKLINGEIIYTTLPVRIDDRDYYTNDPELLLRAGEKEIVDVPMPDDGGKHNHSWAENDTRIIGSWIASEYTEAEKREIYVAKVNEYIREQYTQEQENKIVRERIAYPDSEEIADEFSTYNSFVEDCKARAHAEVYGDDE